MLSDDLSLHPTHFPGLGYGVNYCAKFGGLGVMYHAKASGDAISN
jgi:hypothetical protein